MGSASESAREATAASALRAVVVVVEEGVEGESERKVSRKNFEVLSARDRKQPMGLARLSSRTFPSLILRTVLAGAAHSSAQAVEHIDLSLFEKEKSAAPRGSERQAREIGRVKR